MTQRGNDIITIEKIQQYLPEDIDLHFFDSIDSTNNFAKEIAAGGASHGTSVIALHQTGGRGRLGRSFHAPSGSGIYLSIILRPGTGSENPILVTTAAAVAVCRAIRKICGYEPQIKWVNDIYLNDKKVCGILTEALTNPDNGKIDALIAGIGINCSIEGFPEDLLEIAGAVEGDYSRSRLAAQVITEIMSLVETLDERTFISEYRELSLVTNKMIRVYKGGYSPDKAGVAARVLDIDENGGLVVLYSSGEQEILYSGEISIRL